MNAVVFAGPTISRDDIHARLDAQVRPPAASGDLARAAASGASVIVLIDGIYERTPAVGHKEILWALECGVGVYGAASMGALRAAELDSFGMVGVGYVYERLRDRHITSDDAVAVAHLDSSHDHRAMSIALVDIEVTLGRASDAGVIDDHQCRALIEAAAALFYPDRIWPTIVGAVDARIISDVDAAALRTWLQSGHRSQKTDDACAVLERTASDIAGQNVAVRTPGWTLARTAHWRRVESNLALSHAMGAPIEPSEIDEHLRSTGDDAEIAQRALLQHLSIRLAKLEGVHVDTEHAVAELRTKLNLDDDETLSRWLDANDLDIDGCRRLANAQACVTWAAGRFDDETRKALADVLRIRGRYPADRSAVMRPRQQSS